MSRSQFESCRVFGSPEEIIKCTPAEARVNTLFKLREVAQGWVIHRAEMRAKLRSAFGFDDSPGRSVTLPNSEMFAKKRYLRSGLEWAVLGYRAREALAKPTAFLPFNAASF